MKRKNWKHWGSGPSLLILLVAAAILILAAVIGYLYHMHPVPTHPPENGSIIEVEPGATMQT
jgi:hypothetical protein